MMNSRGEVTVSLVSHGHGEMVWRLVEQLAAFPEVGQVIVTLNIPEDHPERLNEKVTILKNASPKGFGQNHNEAFSLVRSQFYCVINPDIELSQNPFDTLISIAKDQRIGLVAPLVFDKVGVPEDSMRRFLTPLSMLRRILGLNSGAYFEHCICVSPFQFLTLIQPCCDVCLHLQICSLIQKVLPGLV